jgi:hypothetical protein
MKDPIGKLKERKSALEARLAKENERTTKVFANVGWSAGMRKTKIGPSFEKTDELQEKLDNINKLIDVFETAI